ncbi:transcription termination factor Rho [Georgenia soli]|uniref:Transcription termination factor Rho n=1 Tax=Georgenia soli TaxID=638953 RepID=A0A2A9EQ81_9MICO|nr:transcription termination factor Rho [Georgenia soli]PFG40691.1 transcription termination factor Rho [Georgenia soli]
MTETVDAPNTGTAGSRRGSLTTLRLPELQALAGEMGLKGTAKMRKSDLVAAIREARGDGNGAGRTAAPKQSDSAASKQPDSAASKRSESAEPKRSESAEPGRAAEPAKAERAQEPSTRRSPEPARAERTRTERPQPERTESEPTGSDAAEAPAQLQLPDVQPAQRQRRGSRRATAPAAAPVTAAAPTAADPAQTASHEDAKEALKRELAERAGNAEHGGETEEERARRALDALGEAAARRRDRQEDGEHDQPGHQSPLGGRNRRDDDEHGSRSRRRSRDRNRDRKRRGTGRGDFAFDEPVEVSEDDVLLPVAGILDVLENYAFVRTSGYLPGPNDVYVTLGQVKKNGLRRGDAITGAVRQPREGEQQTGQRQKFNALVRLDTVNGMGVEQARKRPDFTKLTPLYPQEQLRLETTPKAITPRVIDLVAPIGKGQRGLIVSPPKAGKTIIMQQIANAISVNNPQVHLMVVLVDERPEEVTDMERMVKGEVIASTFDRPASDHTIVAELAIERAKRLVELGQDVVVLLDSLTRLSRAYNLAAPASGRILSGGVDASALYPPKKFFGAARNIENGGSLTILASALVETGSKMDEVIFEEFKGTGNMELRLARQLADKRIFPAVDVNASGTRREELLMAPEELKIVWKLRRVMGALDQQQAIDLLLGKLRETSSNAEFLMTVQKTTPTPTHEPELAIR